MDWRTAKSLLTLRDQVDAKYPKRDKSSDGTIGDDRHAATTSDHNPDPRGVVHAMDFTHDPAHGFDSYKFADILRQNKDPRIRYVISNRRIMGDEGYAQRNGVEPWTWGSYTGSNPHDQHVHISVNYNDLADDTQAWIISDGGPVKPTEPSPSPDQTRFTNITATMFSDESVAYTDVAPGWNSRYGVALPYHFPGTRPTVRVWKDGKSIDCEIVDVGPWYDGRSGWPEDPYWQTHTRPRAESDPRTNGAAIDLTPAADAAIGLEGKGLVDWEFVEAAVEPPPPPPLPKPTNPRLEAALKEVTEALRPIMEKYMAPPPEPKPAPPAPPVDWGKVLQPLIQQLAPLILPYIIQALPTLLPVILKAMSGQKTSGMSTGATVGTAAGVGGIGALIGGLLTAFLQRGGQ